MAASGSVQSVDRVLDLLEILALSPGGLLLSELAAASGLHVSTTHRLVNVLVDRGYAVKEPAGGKYRLTLRTFELGSRVSGMWDLLSAARPGLDRLAAEGEFENLKGLIYFTDGYGVYPARMPEYDTIFVFLDENDNRPQLPPWAIQVVLNESEIETMQVAQ